MKKKKWRPMQKNEENFFPPTTINTYKSASGQNKWIPKQYLHYCENGYAWVQKSTITVKPTPIQKSLNTHQCQHTTESKVTKVWIRKTQQYSQPHKAPPAATGKQHIVTLVAPTDWITFLRKQQGYSPLQTGPDREIFSVK